MRAPKALPLFLLSQCLWNIASAAPTGAADPEAAQGQFGVSPHKRFEILNEI
jgi:hypothetical protein